MSAHRAKTSSFKHPQSGAPALGFIAHVRSWLFAICVFGLGFVSINYFERSMELSPNLETPSQIQPISSNGEQQTQPVSSFVPAPLGEPQKSGSRVVELESAKAVEPAQKTAEPVQTKPIEPTKPSEQTKPTKATVQPIRQAPAAPQAHKSADRVGALIQTQGQSARQVPANASIATPKVSAETEGKAVIAKPIDLIPTSSRLQETVAGDSVCTQKSGLRQQTCKLCGHQKGLMRLSCEAQVFQNYCTGQEGKVPDCPHRYD